MAMVHLFSDGSFFFGNAPTFGWLAVGENDRILAAGSGRCRNDGSNNVAGELAGALRAVVWAVEAGFDHLILHSDLSSLANHFRSEHPRPGTYAADVARWVSEHRSVNLEIRWTRDTADRHLKEAHHLSRSPGASFV